MASSELQPMNIYLALEHQLIIFTRDNSFSPGWSALGGETLSPYDLKVGI